MAAAPPCGLPMVYSMHLVRLLQLPLSRSPPPLTPLVLSQEFKTRIPLEHTAAPNPLARSPMNSMTALLKPCLKTFLCTRL